MKKLHSQAGRIMLRFNEYGLKMTSSWNWEDVNDWRHANDPTNGIGDLQYVRKYAVCVLCILAKLGDEQRSWSIFACFQV